RYLDLLIDYANRWCDHIEYFAENGQPIQCSILPAGEEVTEMGRAGKRFDDSKEYKVFYSLVSDNTSYDIAGHLLDLYRVTRVKRYLTATQMIMNQFFDNGCNGRPAQLFSEGKWKS